MCTNTLCAVLGGDAIFAALKEHLGVGNAGTTPDDKVTLEHIECNAACDYAPVVMVNWEFFDNQTVESAKELVDKLRAGDLPRADARRASRDPCRDVAGARRLSRRRWSTKVPLPALSRWSVSSWRKSAATAAPAFDTKTGRC